MHISLFRFSLGMSDCISPGSARETEIVRNVLRDLLQVIGSHSCGDRVGKFTGKSIGKAFKEGRLELSPGAEAAIQGGISFNSAFKTYPLWDYLG